VSRIALVAGASEGIGRAIAAGLAGRGFDLYLVARRAEPLEALVADIGQSGTEIATRQVDLTDDTDRRRLIDELQSRPTGVDLVVHSAGLTFRADLIDASLDDFDRQYQANVRAPFDLVRGLVPALVKAQGQVVFVNSSAGMGTPANAGQYAATMHAQRALASALRDEVNPHGVRVTTIFPGRTATPRQQRIHEHEGRPYRPERLLQPEDVAAMIVAAVELPRTAEVTEIVIRSMLKP
jgi:NADP-dependent 3-hydroxy acid dehydrogenase YdfG